MALHLSQEWYQLGKLHGAELKIARLKLAMSGQSLAHIKALLQADIAHIRAGLMPM